MFDALRRQIVNLKDGLKKNSCAHLIMLISIMPRLGGFSLASETLFIPFWVIHFSLIVYVYIVGVIVYQLYYSIGLVSYISSLFNIIVACLILNNSFWFLIKRKDISDLLEVAQKNDASIIERCRFISTYRKLMTKIKVIIITCYSFHFVNDVLIFIPSRIFDMESFAIVSCVGLEPFLITPQREICMFLLAGQELTSSLVVSGYDVIILFFFCHTTAIFIILSMDMEKFSELTAQYNNSCDIGDAVYKELKNLIQRHTLVLLYVNKVQSLFSIAIGIVFFVNVVSVCAFFVLPLEAALSFAPLIWYTLTVFFLYCLLGQRLINASERFETAVYSCGWEKLGIKEQRVVFLMLIQAQKPVVLRIGDLVPIDMTTFADVLQNIYRFITVFKI